MSDIIHTFIFALYRYNQMAIATQMTINKRDQAIQVRIYVIGVPKWFVLNLRGLTHHSSGK